jgi:hypothetical protein
MKTLSVEITEQLELTIHGDSGTEQIKLTAALTPEIARQLGQILLSPGLVHAKSVDGRVLFGAQDHTHYPTRRK